MESVGLFKSHEWEHFKRFSRRIYLTAAGHQYIIFFDGFDEEDHVLRTGPLSDSFLIEETTVVEIEDPVVQGSAPHKHIWQRYPDNQNRFASSESHVLTKLWNNLKEEVYLRRHYIPFVEV
jgi:hypothetical protein